MKEQNPHHEVKKRDGGFLIQTQKSKLLQNTHKIQ